jgi:RNA polymerase I-specific transcription initiation factor RRN5
MTTQTASQKSQSRISREDAYALDNSDTDEEYQSSVSSSSNLSNQIDEDENRGERSDKLQPLPNTSTHDTGLTVTLLQPTLKRKYSRSDLGDRHKRRRALQKYIHVLNDAIDGASGQSHNKSSGFIAQNDSFVVGSVWTRLEKKALYEALDRNVSWDLDRLALAVSTKSRIEIKSYLDHSQSDLALIARSRSRHRHLLPATEFPAAEEISDDTCEKLDLIADMLEERQLVIEANQEKEVHGDGWLVTTDLASAFKSQLKEDSAAAGLLRQSFPAADFFKLHNWLRLSLDLFMNSAKDPEKHYATFSQRGEKPSIRRTAVEDFYSLAKIITRRLVTTVAYISTTRSQALQSRHFTHKSNLITRDDVLTAIDCLGLKQNSDVFWQTAPRRLGLRIFLNRTDIEEDDDASDLPTGFDYADIERQLQTVSTLATLHLDFADQLPRNRLEKQPESDFTHASSSSEDETLSEPVAARAVRDFEDAEITEFLEFQDMRDSRLKENELLANLEWDVTAEIDDVQQTPADCPWPLKTTTSDVEPWAKKLRYSAPWEA